MGESGRGGVAGWLIDSMAAAVAGGAAGWCALVLLGPLQAAITGSAVLAIAMLGLRAVKPEPRRYPLPVFELPGWEAEPEVLELTELEPLVLQDALPAPDPDSRVVQLFARQPLPTAGELKARIDAHLEGQPHRQPTPAAGGEVVSLPVDASAALRNAIADLRRSLA